MKKEFKVFKQNPNPRSGEGTNPNEGTDGGGSSRGQENQGAGGPTNNDAQQQTGTGRTQTNLSEQEAKAGAEGGAIDKAGPSAEEASGESEDITGDGTKERGVKNSAQEGQGTASSSTPPATAQNGPSQQAQREDEEKGGQTDSTRAAANNDTATADARKAVQERRDELEEQQKDSAKARQPLTISRSKSQLRVIGNTLKALAVGDEDFQTSNIQSVRKAIQSASDTLEGSLEKEDIGPGEAGITDNNEKAVITFAPGMSKGQKVAALISQLQEVQAQLAGNKEQAGRTKHSTNVNSVSENIDDAIEKLGKFKEA